MASGQAGQETHGLFRLHPPLFYDAKKHNTDIVAIHGLGGHCHNTWTDSDGHLWLRDSLPDHIPGVRVMTYGYDSSFIFAASKMGVSDFAIDLLTRLRHARQLNEEKSRPLVFICHSLGGVVFKEMLIQAALDPEQHGEITKHITGVVSSVELETISRHSTQLMKKFSIVSFYEQKRLGFTMIVEPFSAILGLPNERAVPINANHREIARVSPRKEQRYLPVWAAVKEMAEVRTQFGISLNLEKGLLWEAIGEVLAMDPMRLTYIAIDALEELGTTIAVAILSGFWNVINHLNTTKPRHRVRILVSSRHNPAYISNLPSLSVLRITQQDIKTSIAVFLSDSVEELAATNGSFNASAESYTRNQIVRVISDKSEGMFLWASMVWDDFRRGLLWNQGIVQQKLADVGKALPGINALYDKLMDSIDPTVAEDMREIFVIISAAARPMKADEIAAVLSISRARHHLSTSADLDLIRGLGSIIETHFPDLIKIHDDDAITFTHLSFEEYLRDKNRDGSAARSRSLRAERMVTRACLKYLKLGDLVERASIILNLSPKYPFLEYATSFVFRHLSELPPDDSLWLLFADLAGDRGPYHLRCLLSGGSPMQKIINEMPVSTTKILIREFADHGYDLNEMWQRPPDRGGPFLLSCYRLHERKELIFLLLRLGIDPSLPKGSYRSTAKAVAEWDGWDVLYAMIEHGFDLNQQDAEGQYILHYVIQRNAPDVLCHLLDNHDVDVNLQDHSGFAPLHLAASKDSKVMARKLLNVYGIRADLIDNRGRTPLAVATYWSLQDVALTFLEHSQAFPIPDQEHLSPAVFAAKHGDLRLCMQLLEACKYKNLQFHIDYAGKGVLHHAAANDWSHVLRLCLTHGKETNVNQIDHSGGSALHVAAKLGNSGSCQVLIDYGASLQLQDRNGSTAAQLAADAGFKDTLMVLLRSGRVDPNQRDHQGRNLVHWAATLDCVDVMQLILAMPGVEIARRDGNAATPVDIACRCCCARVGRCLADEMDRRGMHPSMSLVRVDWEGFYCSPDVRDFQDGNQRLDGLTAAEYRYWSNQQNNNEEWNKVHRMYPDWLWGVVRYDQSIPAPPPGVVPPGR
ncbi:ankyrin repeat-containing domain protein [Cercophora scortea]|uniref:Ankyrin repeat-containing domain protein n=1 Tax=Cercophora scortea TaxID=314031 RepID=A0AAE0M709_9PEZI|nr:ankyrin repeat-containing domain protein [Cercophora scortea]